MVIRNKEVHATASYVPPATYLPATYLQLRTSSYVPPSYVPPATSLQLRPSSYVPHSYVPPPMYLTAMYLTATYLQLCTSSYVPAVTSYTTYTCMYLIALLESLLILLPHPFSLCKLCNGREHLVTISSLQLSMYTDSKWVGLPQEPVGGAPLGACMGSIHLVEDD